MYLIEIVLSVRSQILSTGTENRMKYPGAVFWRDQWAIVNGTWHA